MPSHPLVRLGLLAGLGVWLLGSPLAALAQDAPAQPAAGGGEAAAAQGEAPVAHHPRLQPALLDWSFAGIFGKYDPQQLQRGYNVYANVCSACHSMNMVAFRNLADPGGPNFTTEQVQALAAGTTLFAGTDQQRTALLADHLPAPLPTEYNGVIPPDLSLMAKARGVPRGFPWFLIEPFTQYQEAGPDYIHGVLTGYQDPPEGVTVPPNTYYNPYFVSADVISMPPPLHDGQVSYPDGTPETVDQYARDVAAFLMWAAEPHLVARKQMGFQVTIFLIVFAVLMYLTKRKIWHSVHEPHPDSAAHGTPPAAH